MKPPTPLRFASGAVASNFQLPTSNLELLAFLLILIVAVALRLYQLDAIPPGLTHDEAGHGHDAIAILNGARPIYLTVGYGREPLYDYLNAAAMSVFGPTALTMRLTSVFASILLIPIVYLLVRRWFGAPAALATVALLAVSFWPLTVSRQALRSTLLPILFTSAVAAFWSLRSYPFTSSPPHPFTRTIPLLRILARAAAFALLIAATLYAYIPARILWAIFVLFLIYLAVFHRADFKRLALPVLLGLLVAGLLAWPMFDYLRMHPGAEARLSMLDAPLQALQRGDVSVILNDAVSAVAAWFVPGHGDNFLAYTLRGRPIFDPVTFALFVLGLALCLRNFRKPQHAFLLIWLVVGVSPSLLTGNDASLTRSIGAMPVFYILPALAVVWLAKRPNRRPRLAVWTFVALVIFTLITSFTDYFSNWGQSPDVRAAYQHPVTEIAARASTFTEPIAVSSVYPAEPHDPYVAQVALSLDRPPFRWFDARAALVFPPGATTLVIPASTPPDPYWLDLIGQPAERVSLRAGDLDPYFDVYRWDAVAAAHRALDRASPVMRNFGDAVALIGVDLLTPSIDASDSIAIITYWQVLDPDRLASSNVTDAVLFTHALDASGAIAGQQDQLDAPSWSWRVGDRIAQIHRFALRTAPAPGPLSLEVGVFDRLSGARLPLIVEGRPAGDSVIVAQVEVTP